MSIARLREDRRGSAALIPVFIILSVLVLATTVSSLLFTQSVAERALTQQATAAASRSAVAALTAELNTKPFSQIDAERKAAGTGYQPKAWIPSAHQTLRVTAITNPSPTTVKATFTVDTPLGEPTEPLTVEFISITQRLDASGWTEVPSGTAGGVKTWVPARTVTEAP